MRGIFRKSVAALFAVLCSIFIVLSCSPNDRRESFIYFRLQSNPTTLDPAMIVDVTGGSIAAKLFNGLVRLDSDLSVVSDIAYDWDIWDDSTRYVFKLTKGIKFINNREVIASDIKYSFKRVLDPKRNSPNTWIFERISGAKEYMMGRTDDISGIEIIDDHTLAIRLDHPFSPFLNLLTMTAASVVPREEVELRGSDFATHPAGTGPFLLKEWKHNNVLVLEKNNNYFGEGPWVEGIVYRIIPEDLTAVTEFELGNLDVITIPSYEYSRFRGSERWKRLISSREGLNTYYLGFNCSRPPFDDVHLRRAVFHAIDREKILRTFYEGRGRLASGPVPDRLRNWEPHEELSYAPEKARATIEEKGMRGKSVTFYITAEQEVIDMAEIIQSYLMSAGLTVSIRQLEWSAYKDAINNGEPDMFWISWWADYADPENFLYPLFHSSNHGPSGNRTLYKNKKVDQLIEEGQKAVKPSERNRYYMLAEKIITEETPWVFFWHKTDYTIRQPYVKHFKMFPLYTMDKGVEFTL